jgi:hypothetical protein
MKLEYLGSSITDNQFLIHILNYMTSDYNIQLEMMEKRVNDKVKPLTKDEIRDDLHLRFKRLNIKMNEENESEVIEDLALFDGQFKGKCRNRRVIGCEAQDCKNKNKKWWKLRKFTKWHLLHLLLQIRPIEEELFQIEK